MGFGDYVRFYGIARSEGVLLRYLDVDGAWRDHHSYAITAEELPIGGLTGRLVREGRASH